MLIHCHVDKIIDGVNMNQVKILVIEDDPHGGQSVVEAMEDIGFKAELAVTGEDGIKLFREMAFDVVLSDLMLPDISGVDVLSSLSRIDKNVPVLIMTAHGSVSSAVDALKLGAYDYISKPLELDDIQAKVKRAVEIHRLRDEVLVLKDGMRERYAARSIVAHSKGMKTVLEQIEALANTNATVFVHGESGTGKELVARALHFDSGRAKEPFVAVNCGAFTESLLDSELFGHEKGSFTGAAQQHKGAFERANGGTLFLDEIGNASPAVQVKLLRVLEERELWRVGGQNAIKVNVRIVSASLRDLSELVTSGDFREDLLYRMKVATINIPPLRLRRDDIIPLAERFLAMASEEHDRSITKVDKKYYERLEQYDWPGNVRELRNVVEVSVVLARGSELGVDDIHINEVASANNSKFIVPAGMSYEEIDKEILTQVLARYKGNRTIAAEELGLSRRTIQRKIKEYELPF